MSAPYIEADCTFVFEGKPYTSGGAVITDRYIIGYCSSDMRRLTTWRGEDIGAIRVVSQWPTPHSWVSNCMYQVETTVNGVRYTGRTAGEGMIAKLRRCAKQ